jgi:hypothetical protein
MPPLASPIPVPIPVTAPPVPPGPAREPAAQRAAVHIEAPSVEELVQALERGNTGVVTRALYVEIMGGAETLWVAGVLPKGTVWELVCESRWYQEHFVPLGLKPVSDFYGIVEDIIQTLGTSPPREKVAELLSKRGFAQILLALREVFQRLMK